MMECTIELIEIDENGIEIIEKECVFPSTTTVVENQASTTTAPTHPQLPATGGEVLPAFAAIGLVVIGLLLSRLTTRW